LKVRKFVLKDATHGILWTKVTETATVSPEERKNLEE
jgi:hypothetical protein